MAFLHGPRDLRIETLDIPELKSDQVLVTVGACRICGFADIALIQGAGPVGVSAAIHDKQNAFKVMLTF